MPFLITDQAPGDQLRTLAGGKAHNLHILTAAGFPVPRWAVLGTDAFHAAVAAAGLQLSDAPLSLPERLREAAYAESVVRDLAIPAAILDAIGAALDYVGNTSVAVRSSGRQEDGASHSFAGLFDTILNVTGPAAVEDAVRRCWASAFSERAVRYRHMRGLDFHDVALAVIVQRLVQPRSSGVMFTADPVTGSPDRIVDQRRPGSGRGSGLGGRRLGLRRGRQAHRRDGRRKGRRQAGDDRHRPRWRRPHGGRSCRTTTTLQHRPRPAGLARRPGITLGTPFRCSSGHRVGCRRVEHVDSAVPAYHHADQRKPFRGRTSRRRRAARRSSHLGQLEHHRELRGCHLAPDVHHRPQAVRRRLSGLCPQPESAVGAARSDGVLAAGHAGPVQRSRLLQPVALVPHGGHRSRVSAEPACAGSRPRRQRAPRSQDSGSPAAVRILQRARQRVLSGAHHRHLCPPVLVPRCVGRTLRQLIRGVRRPSRPDGCLRARRSAGRTGSFAGSTTRWPISGDR